METFHKTKTSGNEFKSMMNFYMQNIKENIEKSKEDINREVPKKNKKSIFEPKESLRRSSSVMRVHFEPDVSGDGKFLH